MQRLLDEERFFIRTFAEEISVECFAQGIELDVRIAEYFIKSILINPDYEFIHSGEIDKSKQDEILRLGVQFFTRGPTPDVSVLKIQGIYAIEYVNDENIINEHNKLLFAYIEPLMQFVIAFQIKNPAEDNPILFRKMILLTGLLGGMGDPSLPKEYEELEAAISSVISEQELQAFVRLNPFQKREQITKLSQIIMGIRIRNKQKEKGDADMVNLPTLVNDSIEATLHRLERFKKKYQLKIEGLTYSLSNYYNWDPCIQEVLMFDENAGPYKASEFTTAKHTLLLFHQVSVTLGVVIEHIEKMKLDRKYTELEMLACLTRIDKDTEFRAIIPVEVIYSKFFELSLYWNKFQNMIILLSFFNRMIKKIDNIVKETIALLSDLIKENMSRFENDPDYSIDDYKEVVNPQFVPQCVVIYPDDMKCMIVQLELNGFCPVYCGEGNGMLYKANRQVGVLKYEDKYYGFKDCYAAKLFGSDPEWYVTKILDFARRNMFYMDLFNLRSLILKMSIDVLLISIDTEQTVLIDAVTQTDVHPYLSNLDKDYKSSIWEWRKALCQTANLIHYRTHSTQTYITIFKSSVWTQTVKQKDISVQTMNDNYTFMPTLSTFLYGTRGIPLFPEPHVIHLTRPPEDPPFEIYQ